MARVRGALMSQEASGNFAGQMQFRCNRYGGHVYRPPNPATQNQRPATQKQAAVRARYALARAAWNAKARQADVTGFNLFMAAVMRADSQPGGTRWDHITWNEFLWK